MAIKGTVGHGKDFYFSVDITTGGALTDISGDTTEVSWPQAAAIAEAMGAGDSYEEYVAGLAARSTSRRRIVHVANR